MGDEKEAVASIMNYLFKKAEDKGQFFQEGTYIIEGKDERLFNFLKEVSGCYERVSSHEIGDNQSQHFGIDMPKGSFSPKDKKHILFFSTERDSKKYLFLKSENYGTKE